MSTTTFIALIDKSVHVTTRGYNVMVRFIEPLTRGLRFELFLQMENLLTKNVLPLNGSTQCKSKQVGMGDERGVWKITIGIQMKQMQVVC